jgi:hypothetical protein
MLPITEMLKKAEEYRDLFDALTSFQSGEDVSKLNFGHGIPNDMNQKMVTIAKRFQEAMAPIERLKQAVEDQLEDIVEPDI